MIFLSRHWTSFVNKITITLIKRAILYYVYDKHLQGSFTYSFHISPRHKLLCDQLSSNKKVLITRTYSSICHKLRTKCTITGESECSCTEKEIDYENWSLLVSSLLMSNFKWMSKFEADHVLSAMSVISSLVKMK